MDLPEDEIKIDRNLDQIDILDNNNQNIFQSPLFPNTQYTSTIDYDVYVQLEKCYNREQAESKLWKERYHNLMKEYTSSLNIKSKSIHKNGDDQYDEDETINRKLLVIQEQYENELKHSEKYLEKYKKAYTLLKAQNKKYRSKIEKLDIQLHEKNKETIKLTGENDRILLLYESEKIERQSYTDILPQYQSTKNQLYETIIESKMLKNKDSDIYDLYQFKMKIVEDENIFLKEKISLLSDEVDTLACQPNQTLENINSNLIEELTKLKIQLTKQAPLIKSYEESQIELKTYFQKNVELENDNIQVKIENDSLKEQNKFLQNEILDVNKMIEKQNKEFYEKILDFETMSSKDQNNLHYSQNQLNFLRDRYNELEKKYFDLEFQNNINLKKISDLERINRLCSDEKESKILDNVSNIKECQTTITIKDSTINELTQQLNMYSKQIEELKLYNTQIDTDYNNLLQSELQKEEISNNEKAKYLNNINSLELQINKIREQNKSHDLLVLDLNSQISILKNENNFIKQHSDEEIRGLKLEDENDKKVINNLQEKVSHLEKENSKIKNDFDTISLEVKIKSDELKRISNEHVILKANNDKISNDNYITIKNQTYEITQTNKQLDIYKNKLKEYEKKINELENMVNDLKIMVSQVENRDSSLNYDPNHNNIRILNTQNKDYTLPSETSQFSYSSLNESDNSINRNILSQLTNNNVSPQ